MANIDRNFLARPDFVVSTGENGQTVTLTLQPTFDFTGGYEQESYNITGWYPLIFTENPFLNSVVPESPFFWGIPKTVNPSVTENLLGLQQTDEAMQARFTDYYGSVNFMDFVRKNPIHISKINLRTQNENVLPQQIVIETPNIFAGQCDRQIIDVASRKTAYQYQNGIITIEDADLIICRNSTVRFNSSFSVPNGDNPLAMLPENILYIDITIDKYLSLEKALIENLKIM